MHSKPGLLAKWLLFISRKKKWQGYLNNMVSHNIPFTVQFLNWIVNRKASKLLILGLVILVPQFIGILFLLIGKLLLGQSFPTLSKTLSVKLTLCKGKIISAIVVVLRFRDSTKSFCQNQLHWHETSIARAALGPAWNLNIKSCCWNWNI